MKTFTNKFARFFSLALAIIMVFSFCFVVSAEETATDASGTFDAIDWVYTAADKTITVTARADGNHDVQYNTAAEWVGLDYERIVVEEGITKLISQAFIGCKAKTIILPSSLRTIEAGAFRDSTNLQWLHIPVGVTNLGDSIIQGCSSIKSVYLPLTLDASKMSKTWCNEGKAVKTGFKLYMHGNITWLDNYADLKTLTYAKYSTSFGKATAANIKADGTVAYSEDFLALLTNAVSGDTVIAMNSVTTTGPLEYAEGVNIVSNALIGKSGTAGDVKWRYSAPDRTITVTGTGENGAGTVPATISSTGAWSDLDYNKVIVSEGITELAATSFQSASKMEYISLPSTLKKIGAKSFNYCTKLKTLHIPVGVTTIGAEVVRFCDKLEVIYFPNTITSFDNSWHSEMVRTQGQDTVRTIYYSASTLNNDQIAYKGALKKWGVTRTSVDTMKIAADGTVSYGKFATVLSAAVAGDRVVVLSDVSSTGIPEYAAGVKVEYNNNFVGKTGTNGSVKWTYNARNKTITVTGTGENGEGIVPSKMYETGDWSNLTYDKVVVSEGVTALANEAFQSASKIEYITLPSTLKTIGDKAFNYCTNLKELHIPYGVTAIGDCAIRRCSSLKFVYLPATLVANDVKTTWCYDENCAGNKVQLEALYIFNEILYTQNATLKAKTYDKYYNDGVVVLTDGVFEVNGVKKYDSLSTVIANAADNATIKIVTSIAKSAFVTSNVKFEVADGCTYGNIFAADTNGDTDINVLDFITLIKKVDDTEGTVEINTAGLEFKAEFAATNMVNLKKHLLGVAV